MKIFSIIKIKEIKKYIINKITESPRLWGERNLVVGGGHGSVKGSEGEETMAEDEGDVEAAAAAVESEVDLGTLKERVDVHLHSGEGLGGTRREGDVEGSKGNGSVEAMVTAVEEVGNNCIEAVATTADEVGNDGIEVAVIAIESEVDVELSVLLGRGRGLRERD